MNPSEKAVLAGGCFWGMQDLVRKLPGVLRTRVGYSGGDVPNATYRNHGTHAEALEVEFDPTQTSFRDLLEFFFQIHDPSTPGRQGNDRARLAQPRALVNAGAAPGKEPCLDLHLAGGDFGPGAGLAGPDGADAWA